MSSVTGLSAGPLAFAAMGIVVGSLAWLAGKAPKTTAILVGLVLVAGAILVTYRTTAVSGVEFPLAVHRGPSASVRLGPLAVHVKGGADGNREGASGVEVPSHDDTGRSSGWTGPSLRLPGDGLTSRRMVLGGVSLFAMVVLGYLFLVVRGPYAWLVRAATAVAFVLLCIMILRLTPTAAAVAEPTQQWDRPNAAGPSGLTGPSW